MSLGSVLGIKHFGFLFSGASELLLQWHVLGLPGTFCEVWTDRETGKSTPVAQVIVPVVEVCVTVRCLSPYLELSQYGCKSHVFLQQWTAKKPLSLLFLPFPLSFSAVSFRKLKSCLQVHLYTGWTSVLLSKRKFLFCLLRDTRVLSRRIWIPWWKAA